MCKVWNQAGEEAAAGADICDVALKQTDWQAGCLHVCSSLSKEEQGGDEIQNVIYTVVLIQNGYGFLHLLRLLKES